MRDSVRPKLQLLDEPFQDGDDDPTVGFGIVVPTPRGEEIVELNYDDEPTVVYPPGFLNGLHLAWCA